jgi:hypothetical protein
MEITASLGQRFGKWKVRSLRYYGPKTTEPHFLLRCECGSIQARPQSLITSGKSTSCGCADKPRKTSKMASLH